MRPEKQMMENEYRERISGKQSLIVTEYTGLASINLDRLRTALRAIEVEYLVVKNRIFKRALKDSGFNELSPFLQGQSAVALGGDNLPETSKLLIEFEKEEGSPRIRAAMWDDELFEMEVVKRLAHLPSREVLLSQVLGGIVAPLSGLAGVMSQLLRSLVIVLKEIGQKKAQ